jgi:hypothetical protein
MHSFRSIGTVAAALCATLGLSACGSAGPGNAGTLTNKRDAMLAFAQCVRSHGVPSFPDPGGNGRGGLAIQQSDRAGSGASLKVNGVSVSSPAFQSAMNSCRSKLPNGGHPPPLSASQRQAMLKFSQCMRAHGLSNFPDPTFGGGGGVRIGLGGASGLNPSSPAFQAAQRACGSLQKGPFRIAAGPAPG